MGAGIPENSTLPPETLLKKRKNADRQRVAKKQLAAERAQRKSKKSNKNERFRRMEYLVKDFRDREREEKRVKKVLDRSDNIDVPADLTRLVFVVRVKPSAGTPKKMGSKVAKVLHLLRLTDHNSGVFLKLNKSSAELLKIVEPYTVFGYPSLASVRKLVFKRGYGRVNGEKVALSDNQIIEDALGESGIICLEDLIHEIYTMGPNFKTAVNFLWPFKLATTTSGMGVRQKIQRYMEKEGVADRAEDIDALIEAQN